MSPNCEISRTDSLALDSFSPWKLNWRAWLNWSLINNSNSNSNSVDQQLVASMLICDAMTCNACRASLHIMIYMYTVTVYTVQQLSTPVQCTCYCYALHMHCMYKNVRDRGDETTTRQRCQILNWIFHSKYKHQILAIMWNTKNNIFTIVPSNLSEIGTALAIFFHILICCFAVIKFQHGRAPVP
jgi:hypothetical protein